MEHVNIFHIYHLGFAVHELGKVKEGTKLLALVNRITGTHWMLEHLLEGRPVSLSRCIPFAKIVDDILKELMEKLPLNPAYEITFDDSQKLTYSVGAFERYFAHEVDRFDIFYIPPKGTHSTIKLIEKAEENLPTDTRARLTKETVNDIQQAGRCLVLDAPTAAGFHILRAVETLVTAYLIKVSGKPIPPKNRNWGVYIRELRNGNADKKVTDYLYHMKEYHRNPIMHPEIILTPDEAFSLFNASLSAIVQLDTAIEAWP